MTNSTANDRRTRATGVRRGFTLVELLVVIAIIALLLAILLPALGRAKKLAQTVACLSNQRQIGIASQMWLNEKNGWFPHVYIGLQGGGNFPPPYSKTNGAHPLDGYIWGQYLGWPDLIAGISEFKETARVAYCPADNDGYYSTRGSYEYNQMLGGTVKCLASDVAKVYPDFYPDGRLALHDYKGNATQRKISNLRMPSSATVMADGVGSTFGYRSDWSYNKQQLRWRFFHGMNYTKTPVVSNTIQQQQGDAINFLFADGHTETATLIQAPVYSDGFPELFGNSFRPNTTDELFD